MTTIEIVQKIEWIIPILSLFVVAWTRFNQPPTNRSGTTFVLFSFGVVFYFALIIALWLVVIIVLSQGGLGFDKFFLKPSDMNPKAQEQLEQLGPIFAALIIVVASQFRQVSRIDSAARSFCIQLAAIPREADRLAVELAQSTDFQPQNDRLRSQVTSIVSRGAGPQALDFSNDGTPAARFTRAVGLYWLFIGLSIAGKPAFPLNAHSRSVYARIMQLGEAMAARAAARYDDLMQRGHAYFASPQPSRELEEALNSNIAEVSNLVCSLIARFVLCCEMTRSGRRQRLSAMGFDATHPMPTFGRDQWVTTILAVIVLSVAMMALMPGALPLPASAILTISITFGISIGFAVLGAIVVAQRFIERNEGIRSTYPPIAELMVAALVVAGLTVALRIGFPLVSVLIGGGNLQDVLTQFVERWPGIIIPFACTVSLGLLCSYLGSLNWSWQRVVLAGAIANGLAFAVAGGLVGWLIDPAVLARFYVHPDKAIFFIPANAATTGVLVGAMVLAVFNKSQQVRKEVAARAADDLNAGALAFPAPPVEILDTPVLPQRPEAAPSLGGYRRADVEVLEGRYVCFRPAFTSTDVINAYLIVVHWDEAASCLVFEEQDRVDSGHLQTGRVYIPDGRPFMSFVTVEKGALRLIMVSRSDGRESARGLIMTLSSPSGTQFIPASAPIVLCRIVDEIPQLGFVRPGSPDYDRYCEELEKVVSAYGFFAPAPHPAPAVEAASIQPADDEHLSAIAAERVTAFG
jgi:hypothetical protein